MAPVAPFPDLRRRPTQVQEDRRLLEEQRGGPTQARRVRERQGPQRPQQQAVVEHARARAGSTASSASNTPNSLCSATNSSRGSLPIVVTMSGRSPRSNAASTASLSC